MGWTCHAPNDVCIDRNGPRPGPKQPQWCTYVAILRFGSGNQNSRVSLWKRQDVFHVLQEHLLCMLQNAEQQHCQWIQDVSRPTTHQLEFNHEYWRHTQPAWILRMDAWADMNFYTMILSSAQLFMPPRHPNTCFGPSSSAKRYKWLQITRTLQRSWWPTLSNCWWRQEYSPWGNSRIGRQRPTRRTSPSRFFFMGRTRVNLWPSNCALQDSKVMWLTSITTTCATC